MGGAHTPTGDGPPSRVAPSPCHWRGPLARENRRAYRLKNRSHTWAQAKPDVRRLNAAWQGVSSGVQTEHHQGIGWLRGALKGFHAHAVPTMCPQLQISLR